ncbi:MAG: methionine--tRNA ligase subunit beta [Phycisphaerae bacterium]|jgi:methionyl-tRNA synthetase
MSDITPPAQPTPPAPENQPAPAAPAGKGIITYDDFAKIDLRVAKVLEVREHPNADKLLCLTVDLGTEQRQILAGIRGHYTPESLIGKQIVVVANLAPRKMRGMESNGMLLAASAEEGGQTRVVVLTTDTAVPPGSGVK